MRIVHTESSCGWGGQELRILSEAGGLIARAHEVSVLCPPAARIFAEAPRQGVPVHALPIGRKTPGAVAALRYWLARNRVDVINTHSSTDTWLAALACATLREAPPIVRTRHISAPIPDNPPTRWLYTHATARIVTTGDRLREALVRKLALPPERVISVPTGIDATRFCPGERVAARERLGLETKAIWIGIVATLRSWKGHLYLLDALARIDRPGVRLAIVGDGPMRESIAARVAQLGLAERVLMAGERRAPEQWLRAFDLFCLPSYANEGVPQALIQAMLTGLAVVTTPVGAITEAVCDERTGLVVAPQDAGALARAIERLLDDPALAGRLGRAAREHAAQRFGYDRMIAEMEAVFRSALARRTVAA